MKLHSKKDAPWEVGRGKEGRTGGEKSRGGEGVEKLREEQGTFCGRSFSLVMISTDR